MQPTKEKYKYKFNGKELDTETGLYYYGARYYNPRISQFYATDPLAEKYPNFSPYTYTADNPVMLVDPNGLYITKIGAIWGWIKNGFRGKIFKSKNPATPYHKYGIEYTAYGKDHSVVFHIKLGYKKSKMIKNGMTEFPDGTVHYYPTISQHKAGNFEKIRENVPLLGGLIYDTANGIYTTSQMLFLFRKVGVNMVNLDGTATTTEQGLLGLVGTVSIGAEWAVGVGSAAGKLKPMTTSTQSWLAFLKDFKFREGYKPILHHLTEKSQIYHSIINNHNELIRLYNQSIFFTSNFMNGISIIDNLK